MVQSCPLPCRAGVCGRGERLLVSQLANCSAHSRAEHEGSQAETCLWRLMPWDSHIPGSRGAVTVQPEQSSGDRTLWNGLGTLRGMAGAGMCPGLSFGCLGSSGGEALAAEPRAPQQRQKPKWCVCSSACEHEGSVAV